MKIFVYNDVILDILLERENYSFSAKVVEYVERGIVQGYTSPIIFTNTFYLISKAKNRQKAWESLRKLRLLFKITKMNQNVIDRSLASGFNDFEDAMQYYSALEHKIDYLVTRNKADYLENDVTIVSPKEMIAVLDKE